MTALITGASSGIGKQMAYYLGELGYDLILVARKKEKLEQVKEKIKTNVILYNFDLAKEENVYKLYEKVKKEQIDLLINNAGFGLFGDFVETDLKRELEMIDLNIKAYHILTKLFLKDFVKKDSGIILNVASAAGFLIGPNMSTYYATKNYIAKLTLGIREELKKKKSAVKICALCPGPVATNFEKVAKGKFLIKEQNARVVAQYGIEKAFKNKGIIVPGGFTKLGLVLNRFIPWNLSAKLTSKIQTRTEKE